MKGRRLAEGLSTGSTSEDPHITRAVLHVFIPLAEAFETTRLHRVADRTSRPTALKMTRHTTAGHDMLP
jgi:hypothetical protein